MKLTKHTKRLVGLLVAAFAAVGLYDAIRHADVLVREWPALLSISVGLVWLWAGIDDFRNGAHTLIAQLVVKESQTHPVKWYRAFLLALVKPRARVFGYLIPGSMLLIAGSFLTGVAVPLAAVGALLLLINMMLFQRMRTPRDDFVLLIASQLVIIVTRPGGIPAIIAAV